jgi:hypothetical protein
MIVTEQALAAKAVIRDDMRNKGRRAAVWLNDRPVNVWSIKPVGSEPYTALEMGRRAIAIELKDSYYRQMVINCKSASRITNDLFEVADSEEVA